MFAIHRSNRGGFTVRDITVLKPAASTAWLKERTRVFITGRRGLRAAAGKDRMGGSGAAKL